MLFPYQYVPHQMEKMQEFIDFIFYEVWCKAPGSGPYSLDLFNGNADLKDVMEAFHYSDSKGADFFNGHIQRIYEHFAALTPDQINQFKIWFQANNDIERACANDPDLNLVRYADMPPEQKELCGQLASFFKRLYSKELLGLAALKQKIGDIDDHYDKFMQANRAWKCPFCGISDMHGVYHSYREAYDHYLPKAFYPFNSINFRNLAPACHHCNSTYKSTKDPAFIPKDRINTGVRRKAFYPYANHHDSICIKINLKKPDIDQLTPDDIEIEFGPDELKEEIETWKDVYDIVDRYKAKCCGENDGKYWLFEILDEWKEKGRPPADFLNTVSRHTAKKPFAGCNFLKIAFLEACDNVGLFNEHG